MRIFFIIPLLSLGLLVGCGQPPEQLEGPNPLATFTVPPYPTPTETLPPYTPAPVRDALSPSPKATHTHAPRPRVTTERASRSRRVTGLTRGGVWDRLAACESGGNWNSNTGNGYYGGIQFSLSSWRAVGGSGLPSNASKSEQILRGEKLRALQGWGAWPACTRKLGLR